MSYRLTSLLENWLEKFIFKNYLVRFPKAETVHDHDSLEFIFQYFKSSFFKILRSAIHRPFFYDVSRIDPKIHFFN